MRKSGTLYLILLASEFVLIGVLYTHRGLILSDASSFQVGWTNTWGGPYRDYAYDVVFSGGSLFVTGASFSYGPGPINLVLLKYSGEGKLLWNRTYWEGGYAMGRGLASDGSSVYVSGIHIAENASYSLLLKYDLDGRLIWSREWRPGPDAKSSGIAIDAGGNVYVTGYVILSAFENREFLLKYDGDGSLIYSRVMDANDTETAWGLSVSDAVYICGEVTHNTTMLEKNGGATASMLLKKVSVNGEVIWSRESSFGLDSVANSVDSVGDVVVTGYVSYRNGTAKDVLLRFGGDGDLKSTQIMGVSSIEDIAWGVAVTGPYTYLVGHTRLYFDDLSDASIYKLDPDDEILWEYYYRDYSIDRYRAVTIYGDDVYVVGETYWRNLDMQILVRKYTSPNTTLPPDETRVLRISPLLVGVLLNIVATYGTTRARYVKNRKRSALYES
jgi:hypothetical protein